MNKFLKSFLVCVAVLSIAPKMARAEIFYVEDQNDRFSLSFPDTWSMTGNQKPDDKLTIIAPGENNMATCRMRVREDKRYVIYPRKFADAIQKTAYSRQFWDEYLAEFDDVSVDFFKDEAGLGRGFASMAEVSFTTADQPIAKKRGIMFATLYNDRAFIIDCSSEESVYQNFRSDFLGVVKSVDLVKTMHEDVNGHYRSFDKDEPVEVQGPKTFNVHKL